MAFIVEKHRNAEKEYLALTSDIQAKVDIAVSEIQKSPTHGNHIIKLSGRKNQYRYKLGQYRIIYMTDKDRIIIMKIGPRENIYKSK